MLLLLSNECKPFFMSFTQLIDEIDTSNPIRATTGQYAPKSDSI
jgi:hypothetical protein